MQGHFAGIRQRDMKADTGRHFASQELSGVDDIVIYVLDFIYAPAKCNFASEMRLHVEYRWIHALRTTLPYGLNSMDTAPCRKYCRDVTGATIHNKITKWKPA